MDQFCRDHNIAGWFATSAASNQGIDEAMNFLVTKILEVASANRLPEQNDSLDVGGAAGAAASGDGKKSGKSDCCT